jgi:carbon-monoxide dehydrogenase medium subunit
MKAPRFEYVRAESLDQVYSAFAKYGDGAMILAGGQSLMPILNMRLSQPKVLIDINLISELSGIEQEGQLLKIGAINRHAELASNPLVNRNLPLIASAIKHVAHRGVRKRGTLGGSLSHADPAAEIPACAVALDATIILKSCDGERRVKSDTFFRGVMSTERKFDEILTAVEIPIQSEGDLWAFHELSLRKGDFALVGIAATAKRSLNGVDDLKIVIFGCEERPQVSDIAAKMAVSGASPDQIADEVSQQLNPMSDLSGNTNTKRIQARSLIKRCLLDLYEGKN